jgi:hypothetical protein
MSCYLEIIHSMFLYVLKGLLGFDSFLESKTVCNFLILDIIVIKYILKYKNL